MRRTTRGAPQGAGFSPNLFRGYTNVIPEAGLKSNNIENLNQITSISVTKDDSFLSSLVDEKTIWKQRTDLIRSIDRKDCGTLCAGGRKEREIKKMMGLSKRWWKKMGMS